MKFNRFSFPISPIYLSNCFQQFLNHSNHPQAHSSPKFPNPQFLKIQRPSFVGDKSGFYDYMRWNSACIWDEALISNFHLSLSLVVASGSQIPGVVIPFLAFPSLHLSYIMLPKKHLSGSQKRKLRKLSDQFIESQKGALDKFVVKKNPEQSVENLHLKILEKVALPDVYLFFYTGAVRVMLLLLVAGCLFELLLGATWSCCSVKLFLLLGASWVAVGCCLMCICSAA